MTMHAPTLEFEILRDGSVRVETHGTVGTECREVFAGVDRLLGTSPLSATPKAELYAPVVQPRALVRL